MTPVDRIKCAYLHYCRGVAQEDLGIMFDTHNGRVSEACKAIMKAAQTPMKVRSYNEEKNNGN